MPIKFGTSNVGLFKSFFSILSNKLIILSFSTPFLYTLASDENKLTRLSNILNIYTDVVGLSVNTLDDIKISSF